MSENIDITLADIRKAIDLINERQTPLTRIDLGEAWIEIDTRGNPINIGLSEKGMKAIKECMQFAEKVPAGVEVTTIYGIPIVKSKFINDVSIEKRRRSDI